MEPILDTRRVVPLLVVGCLLTSASRPTRARHTSLIFVAVSAGAAHTCALTAGGQAYCWGGNTEGALGTGERVDARLPQEVAGALIFLGIDAGIQFSCGVSETGAAYCWGANAQGQLGNAATPRSFTPVPVIGGLRFRTVTAGGDYACGVSEDGAVYCWGTNHDGQMGTGDTVPSPRPLPVALGLRFVSITAGDAHTCAVTVDSAAYCWGNNRFGQLGIGKRGRYFTPQRVLHEHKWLMLSAGGRHTCGVVAGRRASVYCWGDNFHGQTRTTGDFSPSAVFLPMLADDSPDILGVTTGRLHTCVFRRHPAYAVGCWGENLDDQLGRHVIGPYRQVSAGDAHTCAVRRDGAIYCWGRNASGQLGDGTLFSQRLPVRVAEPIALRP